MRKIAFLVGWLGLAAVGGCQDDPVLESTDATATGAPAGQGVTCQTVRVDLDRMLRTMEFPSGIAEAKETVADQIDQMDALARKAGELAGDGAEPVTDSIDEAFEHTRRSVEAVVAGNFGIAREQVQQAKDDLHRASERLEAVCEGPPD